jgi:hypothetical protein
MAFQLKEFFAPWLNSTPEQRLYFLRDPRQAMEQIVGVPSDIPVSVDQCEGEIWFQASVPKFPEEGQGSLLGMRRSNERMNRCPVLRVSGREFIDNHVQILAEYGIRVPEDVVVLIDAHPNGYLHFRVRLDVLYSP